MDGFNNGNEINTENEDNKISIEYTPNDKLYDAVDHEYEIKLEKMKTKNRILGLLTVIFISVAAITVVFAFTKNSRDKQSPDTDDGIYSSDTQTDAPANTHFSPEFTDYQDLPIVQQSSEGRQELTPTEVYNSCVDSTVIIYSYEGNQIKTPTAFATGTVLSEDGFIITNHHVVEGFTNFSIQTHDGREYEALLVGSDEKTDLAVIKAVGARLTPAQFGYVSEMNVGDSVYAIGNPSGLNGSITTGIVSSLDRTISSLDPYTISHLQIDAAVNTGNSGGELINKFGQVVGIVDAKFVADFAEGIGFAISMDEAKPIIEDIIKNGKVTGRVKLGISYTAVTEEKAKLTGDTAGLHVTSISKTLPIADTELKEDDIIIDINGYDVSRQEEFRKAIREMHVGDSITMTVLRDSQEITIVTEVGEYDE